MRRKRKRRKRKRRKYTRDSQTKFEANCMINGKVSFKAPGGGGGGG